MHFDVSYCLKFLHLLTLLGLLVEVKTALGSHGTVDQLRTLEGSWEFTQPVNSRKDI